MKKDDDSRLECLKEYRPSRRALLMAASLLPFAGIEISNARAPVSLRDFGAIGNGEADDSDAWNRFLEEALIRGAGFIPAGHYRLGRISQVAPRPPGLRLIGEGSSRVLLEGTNTKHATAFSLANGSLEISGIATKNITLIEAHKTITADIPKLSIRDWHWQIDAPEGLRALSIFSPHREIPHTIDDVQISSIRGVGGVCGLWLRTAMRQCFLDDIEIRNIRVPDRQQWYFRQKPNRMSGIGTASGLLVGDDTLEAQAHYERCDIGRVVIDGVRDERPLHPLEERPANCDGVRLIASNVRVKDLTIRNVSNHAKRDCTGLYTKIVNFEGEKLTIENAGHHEASLTCKGATAFTRKRGAGGKKIRLKHVEVSNTEGFVGRPAIYISSYDVSIDRIDVFGCGGDVEDPYKPGERIPGASGVVRFSPPLGEDPALDRLHIKSINLRDCILGGKSERWAVSLGGYKNITLDEVVCTGLSNAGRFAGQGPDDGQDISVIAFAETVVPCENLTINKVQAEACYAPNRTTSVVSFLGNVGVTQAKLGSIESDGTFDRDVMIKGEIPIGTFHWEDCNPQSITIKTSPIENRSTACCQTD